MFGKCFHFYPEIPACGRKGKAVQGGGRALSEYVGAVTMWACGYKGTIKGSRAKPSPVIEDWLSGSMGRITRGIKLL